MKFLGPSLVSSSGVPAFQPRVNSQTSATSITPNIASFDAYDLSALATGLAVNNPTGTPYDFQRLTIRIADNGVSRAITWGSIYRRAADARLPASTTSGKILSIQFVYHGALSVWVCESAFLSNQTVSNIEFIGAGNYSGLANTTISCNLSTFFTGATALAAGDILLMAECRAASPGPSTTSLTSSGWSDGASGAIYADDSVDLTMFVYRKIMSSSPDSTIEFGSSGSTSRLIMVRAYRNVDQTNPLDVSTTTSTTINTVRPDPPSNTPVSSGSVSVVFGAGANFNAITTLTSADLADTNLGSYDAASGQDIVGLSGHKFLLDTSAFDPAQFGMSGTDSTSFSASAAHIILRTS